MRARELIPAALAVLFTLAPAARAAPDPEKDAFVREDWIASFEPGRPDEWGVAWSVNNFELPYRAALAGKHRLGTRLFHNYRFGSENGGVGGGALRFFVGTLPDIGLFMGLQNIHHQTGHDAAAREFSREVTAVGVSRRFKQMLPRLVGGRELKTEERNFAGRGADSNARANTLPMESEITFAYEHGQDLLAAGRVNSMSVTRFVAERGRFLMDFTEVGTLDQHYLDTRDCGTTCGNPSGKPFSTDFTQYLYNVNTDRYGVRVVNDFKLKMGDLERGIFLQAADPLFLTALYAYSRDYIGRGSNTTALPMIPLGRGVSYLPSWRVFFSPFGVEYFQDNYLRRGPLLLNLFWTKGDNRYERRLGGGFDLRGIPLPRRGKLEVFLTLHRQPLLSWLTGTTLSGNPLTSAELGRSHLAHDVGGAIELPVWTWADGSDDPRRLFLYARGGTKSLAWLPGAYLAAGTYLQTGLGLRL